MNVIDRREVMDWLRFCDYPMGKTDADMSKMTLELIAELDEASRFKLPEQNGGE